MELRDYVQIIVRRWYIGLPVLILFAVGIFFMASREPAVYHATSRIAFRFEVPPSGLKKLKIEPHALLRKKEKAYKSAGLGADATAAQVAKAIAAEPLLLERPVVVKGAKAVIGRPTEAVEALL